jgi:hypothetical protein
MNVAMQQVALQTDRCHHGPGLSARPAQCTAKGDAVNALARAHLFTALRQLDGQHKGTRHPVSLRGQSDRRASWSPTCRRRHPVLALNGAD